MKLKNKHQIRSIAGEQIVIASGDGQTNLTRILSLNPTAVWLWKQLSGKEFTEEDAMNLLLDRFNVDPTTTIIDARGWSDSLKQHDIIEP